MDMLINVLCGLLGIMFIVLSKMGSAKKDFKVANENFSYKQYFDQEITYIGTSVIVVVLLAFCRSEFFAWRPQLAAYERIIFSFTGAIGSWAFGLALGKSKKYIRNIIDEKTNELDAIKSQQTDGQ